MMLKFDFLPNLSNILVNFDNQSFDLTKLGQGYVSKATSN